MSAMPVHSKRLGVVVGVDGSPTARVAACWAARDAELRNVALSVVHALPARARIWPGFVRERWYRRARQILDDAVGVSHDSCTRGGPPKVNTKVVFADPVATLLDLSADAEIVVVGARGRGVLRPGLRGSVSSAVMRRAVCPVAVIHDEDPLMPDPAHAPVLLGAGASLASESAGLLAREEAAHRGVELVVSTKPVTRLVEQSESAQLVVVNGRENAGATVADEARMPVIVTQ